MKSLSEQDHYEILETRRDASPDEIERSYRMVLATYSDDSLAGYSVFDDGDARALRERIELAYRVLANAELRREYDASLGIAGDADPALDAVLAAEAAQRPARHRDRETDRNADRDRERPVQQTLLDPVDVSQSPILQEPVPAPSGHPMADLDPLDDGDGDFDGARLRRYRMRCGLEVEDISSVTKINPTYLRFIEEERYADLPSKVYVRGFVTSFANTLGLDAKRVAASYMKRYDEGQQSRRRSRFFDGR